MRSEAEAHAVQHHSPGGVFVEIDFSCQFHAFLTMVSRSEKRGFQPSTFAALLASATRTGGSPARRGPSRKGTGRGEILPTVSITSRTEYPLPVPRFRARLAPPLARCSSARTCASPRSV